MRSSSVARLIPVLCLLAGCAPSPYVQFLDRFKQEATHQGVDVVPLDVALGKKPTPNPAVLTNLKKQPESTLTLDQYLGRIASPDKVAEGRNLMRVYAAALGKAEELYGVPGEVVVALWGAESAYGRLAGTYSTLDGLATLAFASHRSDFFTAELTDALRVLQQGHIKAEELQGSWAGAMGQSQFMPSTYLKYAVDGNGDGRKDIWQTPEDVIFSAANFLKSLGWRRDEVLWGEPVRLMAAVPAGVRFSPRGLSEPMPVREWLANGVVRSSSLPLLPEKNCAEGVSCEPLARLFIPNGVTGGGGHRSFFVYDNFSTLMKWNNSSYFAFGVMVLADKLAERKGVVE